MFRTIVTVEQLSQHHKDWLILDCRFSLAQKGGGSEYGLEAYRNGHIPGAFYLHLDNDLSGAINEQTGRHPLPDPDQLAEKLRALGLSQQQVVVYDDCGGAMAARAWWLLRWLGHSDVAVLDGGWGAWTSAGMEISSAEETVIQQGDFADSLDADLNVPVSQLISEQKSGCLLVDARGAERYRGEQEPIDPVAGHIPGAVNRPLTDNLQNGHFKSAAQLKREWSEILADHSPEQVIHYCGSGVTACHNQLAMAIAGMDNSRIYAGSWSEWIRDPIRPVATVS